MTDKDPDGTKSAPTQPGEAAAKPARRARPCPVCSSLSTEKYYPFCSKRCADVDLHRWFSGAYTVPVVELDDIDPSEFED